MANIYLSGGNVFSVHDYLEDRYEDTATYQKPDESRSEPGTRKKNCIDIDTPYMGTRGELAIAPELPDTVVVSRDRIETDARSGFLFSRGEKGILKNAYTHDFRRVFGSKYRRKFENANIAFVDSNSDFFSRYDPAPKPLYTSETDLVVVADDGSIDDSFDLVKEVRKEAASDLQKMADKILGT